MKVRVRKHPRGYWIVECKQWYDFDWQFQESYSGDNAEGHAIRFAQDLFDPFIIEIKKEKK